REKAKEMGATDAIKPVMVKINRFYKKHGMPKFIFECAGSEKALRSTFDLIDRGGTICVESIYKGNISLPFFMLNSREISLIGTMSHEREDIEDAIALMESKKVNPRALISKIIPLEEIQGAFEAFIAPEAREFIKIVVKII
ncbi:MAG: zinc-binding dehydrogenase, partial [Candidatus Hodarchaeota archaeon]